MKYKWIPNFLTSTRILLVPVFLYCLFSDFSHGKLLALIIFMVATITDAYDGKIARKHNIVSKFGIFLDPLADKFLVLSAFYAFMFFPVLSTTTTLSASPSKAIPKSELLVITLSIKSLRLLSTVGSG